jgi:hypothetical protein
MTFQNSDNVTSNSDNNDEEDAEKKTINLNTDDHENGCDDANNGDNNKDDHENSSGDNDDADNNNDKSDKSEHKNDYDNDNANDCNNDNTNVCDNDDQDQDIRMHSPETSPKRYLQGASRTSGGIVRGHAHGNVFNFADIADGLEQGPGLGMASKGRVYIYSSPLNPTTLDIKTMKPMATVKVSASQTIAPMLRQVTR